MTIYNCCKEDYTLFDMENLFNTPALFAGDPIVYGLIQGLQDTVVLQNDLDLLLEWSNRWQMPFNPDKCCIIRFVDLKALSFWTSHWKRLY